ncbi:MAG: hypothetical protein SPH93_04930 [Clostridium sp.]|jgi:SMC domain protein|uniref:AAA family ATPase n=1 Tax=Clostridium sp. TaxID=1506 RepID=UPI002A91C8C2|nr:AAA family ATPase [Clostridium sp.]MDY6227005.1 hypothetical protein [Clostridium sp.]
MNYIEKISINNARRLGKNVHIDFGKGATIILAPNGTGKTTIFEAIELALTGKIQRIEDFPDVIIRDGMSNMKVRLDFSDGNFCEVDYSKGGICKKTGEYENIFKIESEASLSYLFRLTHFLEQRGKTWFVEQEEKIAGDILSQLPIGKDIQRILSKKTSLIRAIGMVETNAKNQLNEAKRKLYEYEQLKNMRNQHVVVAVLMPLEEIVEKLQNICNVIKYEQFDGEYKLEAIKNYFEKMKVYVKQQYDSKEELIIKLNTLKERVTLFCSNLELLKQKEDILIEYTERVSELTEYLAQKKKELENKQKCLCENQVKIEQLNLVKNMFDEMTHLQKYIAISETELRSNKSMMIKLQECYKLTNEELKINEALEDKYKLLDQAISKEKKNIIEVEEKKKYQKEWEELSKINNEILQINIPKINNKENECRKIRLQIDNEISEAESLYSIRNDNLKNLNKTSNAIQEAVSTIRKYISVNQRKCPVCQAEYEPEKLISKIETSIKMLNPAIPQAIKDEKDALELLETIRRKQKVEDKKLYNIMEELKREREKFEENHKKIIEVLQPQFPGCKTVMEASGYIKEMLLKSEIKLNQLESQRSQFQTEIIIAKIEEAKLKSSQDERTIKELRNKIQNLENEIINKIQRFNSIKSSLIRKDEKSISEEVLSCSKEQDKNKECIKELELLIDKNHQELEKYKVLFLNEKELVSKIRGIQDGIHTEWKQIGLEDEPNLGKLKISIENIYKSINELEKVIQVSHKIEQELTSWTENEKFNELNNKMKELLGGILEEQYYEDLKRTVSENDSMCKNIHEKKNAIDLFMKNITLEATKIHEQLNYINEPWRRLLKRIVVNPLFSTAPLMSNTTFRNKLISKTSAIVNNQNINISDVASEAQTTDLQLTLMLAMANKYEWTSWKGLLLDDPTQHHDLVHAASVFDVLRDYIIDLDYQVLMSTHDSIQARFFKRKLENEGVPVKIYRLVARKDGVIAELMG